MQDWRAKFEALQALTLQAFNVAREAMTRPVGQNQSPWLSLINAAGFALQNLGPLTFKQEFNNGNSGATPNVNWTNGPKQAITLTANAAFTFTDPVGPCTVTLRIVQDATGNRTATWPATVKWVGAAAPVLSTAAGAVDIVSLYWNGTDYYGVASLNFA